MIVLLFLFIYHISANSFSRNFNMVDYCEYFIENKTITLLEFTLGTF